MPELPVLSGKELLAALERAGFFVTRQRGSHAQMRHADGRRTTVPLHGHRDMPRGTLRAILRDIDITVEHLEELLNG